MFEQQIITHFNDLDEDIPMIEGPINVDVTFYLKGNKDTDLDNLLKALLDGLEGILYKNDKMITSITAHKINKCKENKTSITLKTCVPLLADLPKLR